MIEESGKFYLVSEYVLGKEKIDCFFGKLDLSKRVVKKYYRYIYDNNLKILSKLGIKDQAKKKKLSKENDKIKKENL